MVNHHKEIQKQFKAFIFDTEENEMFITGQAGTGKSTALKHLLEYIGSEESLKNLNIAICAYTHKAVQVIQDKLFLESNATNSNTQNVKICTLHSFLSKHPFINEHAKSKSSLNLTIQTKNPELIYDLLIVDEFSFINEQDYYSIGYLQDELEHADKPHFKPLKVLYLGDTNQLQPVMGLGAIRPTGKYIVNLTKIMRTDTTLTKVATTLVNILNNKEKQHYIEATEHFVRKINPTEIAQQLDAEGKSYKILAYTNEYVQKLNNELIGYALPQPKDIIAIPSLYRQTGCMEFIFNYKPKYEDLKVVQTPNGLIDPTTTFNPLKRINRLQKSDPRIFIADISPVEEPQQHYIVPLVFGSFYAKTLKQQLGDMLIQANKLRPDIYPTQESRQAYGNYKLIEDSTYTADFNKAITIHKSQGSTYDYVIVSGQDLARCMSQSDRIRLLYVAISRARFKVFIDN